MLSIKESIEKGNVKFTVKGITHYRRGCKNNEWGDFPKIFRVSDTADSIFEDDYYLVKELILIKWEIILVKVILVKIKKSILNLYLQIQQDLYI